MRLAAALFALTATVLFTSCSAHAEARHLEAQMEAGIDRFHARLNEGRFGEICAEADESLCGGESGEAFTRRLEEVRGRTGAFKGKAIVIIDRGLGRKIRGVLFSSETITSKQHTACDAGLAVESFRWSVQDGKVTLAGYELRQVFEPGAIPIYGIGHGR